MEQRPQPPIAKDQIARNPFVDPKVVHEAEQARQELEKLGVWQETGSRVRNPFGIEPDMKSRQQPITRRMAQSG